MHPNPAFRLDSRELHEALIAQVGFGMIFVETPNGPRVAHTPIISTGDGAIQFHLSSANALANDLDGADVLAVINGPDAYVSPRWYPQDGEVPTWNYITLELTGRVRRMHVEGLEALLARIGEIHEARIADGTPWQPEQVPQDKWGKLIGAITGFEMEIGEWRPTFKLSQNRPEGARLAVADALADHGSPALADLMRKLVQ